MSEKDGHEPPLAGVPYSAKPPSLTERTMSGLLWVFSGTAAQALLRIAILAILARLLTPSMFGVVSAALVVIGFSDIFSSLGVAPAIVQKRDLSDTDINAGFTVSMFMGILVGAIVYILAPEFAAIFRMPELVPLTRALAIVFPIRSFGTVSQGLLLRHMQFRRTASITIISYGAGYGLVSIAFALNGFAEWSLVYGQIAQTVIMSAGYIIAAKHRLRPSLDTSAACSLMKAGAALSVANLGSFTAQNIDNFITGHWLGAAALGIYSRAYYFLVQPANLFGTVVDAVLYPAMSEAQHDATRLARAYKLSIAFVAMTTLPISAILVVLAPEFVALLLGPQWTDVVFPFRILMAILVCRTGYKMSDTVWRATASMIGGSLRNWLYVGEVALGAYAGHFWGVPGVSIGVALAITTHYLVMLAFARTLLSISIAEIVLLHARYIAVSLVLGALIWICASGLRMLGANYLAVLILAGGLGLALYAAFWMRASALFGEEGAKISELFRKRLAKIRRI